MNVLRKWSYGTAPKLSIILLDWSVRESFHVLNYLNRQRLDRSEYEIIWIEYYDHRAPEIDELMERAAELNLPAPIDTWFVMGHPGEECYHKHRMYNLGIIHAQAPVICIMDSDSVLKTTFVESIIKEFEKKQRQVLHLEQIRNFDQSHYPFNYPTLGQITGEGCVNATKGVPHGFDGKPKTLKKNPDLWHVYNYGACFCARREDMIRFGGADEHKDYLGHICGPYEMTARLINSGIPDQLHPHHYTYHPWHPNTGGSADHCGPNNGKGMSATAMKIQVTGRAKPFFENPEIKKLRVRMFSNDDLYFV